MNVMQYAADAAYATMSSNHNITWYGVKVKLGGLGLRQVKGLASINHMRTLDDRTQAERSVRSKLWYTT